MTSMEFLTSPVLIYKFPELSFQAIRYEAERLELSLKVFVSSSLTFFIKMEMISIRLVKIFYFQRYLHFGQKFSHCNIGLSKCPGWSGQKGKIEEKIEKILFPKTLLEIFSQYKNLSSIRGRSWGKSFCSWKWIQRRTSRKINKNKKNKFLQFEIK